MVEENCSVPFEFKVITDHPERFPDWGVPVSREVVWTPKVQRSDDSRLMMHVDKPQGCWAKLDAFKPGFSEGFTLVLDLDIVILDDIAPLARDRLHMAWQGDKHNGSVYSFNPTMQSEEVYPKVIPYSKYPRGEQEYSVDTYEGYVGKLTDCYSYKIHIASRYGKEPPPGTRIVFFHGYPTPASHSVSQISWIGRTWKGLVREERL